MKTKLYVVEYIIFNNGKGGPSSLAEILSLKPMGIEPKRAYILAENTDSLRDKLMVHLSDDRAQNLNLEIMGIHLMGAGETAICFDDVASYCRTRVEEQKGESNG